MKVCLIHNQISPYRLPLFEELSKKFDLYVYYCKRRYGGRLWSPSLQNYSFKNEVLKSFNVGPFIINYSLSFKLLRDRYDIYLVGENPENLFATFIAFLVAKIFRKPVIIWSGVIETEYSKQIHAGNKVKMILLKNYVRFINTYRRFLYRHADAFVTYCNKSKEFLVKNGVQEVRIFVGGQIMPEELLSEISINKSDTEFKNKKVILYVGYLRKGKGVEYLIKAFNTLKKKNECLVIAGSGPDEERLKSIAKDIDNVYFTGYVVGSEKAKCYSIADIFVFPTLHDPWGHVVTEAMYYGLPVITTTSAGVSEVIYSAKNGYVIEPKDVQALKSSLEKLLNDEKLRESMKKGSKIYIKNHNTLDNGIKPFFKSIQFVQKNIEDAIYKKREGG